MNNYHFRTGGDWDSTTLENNGQEVLASQLMVELRAARGYDGQPERGGIAGGADITAFVRTQQNPDVQEGIFPGSLLMEFPGHSIQIENTHPQFAAEFTRVAYNHRDVTGNLVDVYVNVNAVENEVEAYITLYKAHWLGSDEVATYNIL